MISSISSRGVSARVSHRLRLLAPVLSPKKSMASEKRKLLSFDFSKCSSGELESRLGRLCFRGRTPTDTPHFFAVSSRGAVPHLSQDTMREQTSLKSMYTALEDCESHILRLALFSATKITLTRALFLELGSHRESPARKSPPSLQRSCTSTRIAATEVCCSPERCTTYPGTAPNTSAAMSGF